VQGFTFTTRAVKKIPGFKKTLRFAYQTLFMSSLENIMYLKKPHAETDPLSRRRFLQQGGALLALGIGVSVTSCAPSQLPEKETRILVPRGFEPRLVARSGYPSTPNSAYAWHVSPDGGACFDTGDGGWIYVSNSEASDIDGGVGALRFDANGTVVDSYSILSGSRKNCSGGPTPWNTWLSCEEVDDGLVWECDPFANSAPRAYDSMGLFEHEAACVDPLTRQVYLTEDHRQGCLYRFTPDAALTAAIPDLGAGLLEVAIVAGGFVEWRQVPDPRAGSGGLRSQVADATRFAGGEGIDIFERYLRFTTKYDNRVWQINLMDDSIEDIQRLDGRVNDVDDLTHTPDGAILVAEDGPSMRILYLADQGADPVTLVQLPDHQLSEMTGLAFDPLGTRLYFSSQRGSTEHGVYGLTFELSGDFGSLAAPFELRERILDHGDLRI
jgi:hypothetical protein